ncbi:hypothetical protein HHL22_11955 [Hymenobacter sp. RP-2-7]|uniref:Uncharacterized protein n=1 Tax=Hymenobacter polaris TaxID=2682546 RepID=A0A7Y0AEK5_9BACT|nr:hypothetical protein [Hymenobacter polaris]NML65920.1 hypothetical protein [Hymenobacter polaris]
MPASLTISLNQLALALLGAGAYLYFCRSRGGYWKACATVCGQHVERDHPSPYAALAAVAAVLHEYEARQTALDCYDHPAARTAYRTAWAASAGQPVAARFAAAEAAARAADTLPADAGQEEADDPDPDDLREHDSGNWASSGDHHEDEAERLYRHEQRLAHEQYHPHH